MSIHWTAELLADLANLWTEGLSARLIAAELSHRHRVSVSRNAVIGMSHRLDLAKRPSPIRGLHTGSQKAPAKPKLAEPTARRKRTRISGKIPEGMHVSEKVAQIERKISDGFLEDPDSTPMTLEECQRLGNGCRWPLGDVITRARLFCGAPSYIGSSYCPKHTRLAHVHTEPWRFNPKIV